MFMNFMGVILAGLIFTSKYWGKYIFHSAALGRFIRYSGFKFDSPELDIKVVLMNYIVWLLTK
jgi:hypothetical protein